MNEDLNPLCLNFELKINGYKTCVFQVCKGVSRGSVWLLRLRIKLTFECCFSPIYF